MELDLTRLRNQIELELQYLDKIQIAKFAWHCAMRCIPFITCNGNFDFWGNKNRQKNIYAVFYALDINAFNTYANTTMYLRSANVAAEVINASYIIRSANTELSDSLRIINNNISACVVDSIAYSTRTIVASGSEAIRYAADSFISSIKAAQNLIDIKSSLLFDLKCIKENKKDRFSLTFDTYGNYWNSFQNALRKEGCMYWGRLYKTIFNQNFSFDKAALERRINVPKEIRANGAAAVANYLDELDETGGRKLDEARIIILGDKGSGKTSLARKLLDLNASMPDASESTAGVDTLIWKLEKEYINVHIWDFAGHTITHAVHQFFLSERCLYILVYDGRSEERNRLEYWLNQMKNYGRDSEAIIIVNTRDKHRTNIPINTLKEQYAIVDLYEFSIKDHRDKLAKFRDIVTEYIYNKPSWNAQEIPNSYFKVKEELEELFNKGNKEKGREYITRMEFDKISKKSKVVKSEELLKNLHNLGVSLWYNNMAEYNMLILNPEWISYGVYGIINWVTEKKKHNISLSEFEKVFEDKKERYPKVKHQFLYDLMRHYELAYECKIREGKELIIPHLLKIDRPEKLPEFPIGESLMLRYKSEQPLPPNTISRFIVRHNLEIKTVNKRYLVWRYGVVLESNNCIALVREEDRTISVSVKGNDKTTYLSTLRETLNDIFESYKSDKPELQYRVERFGLIPDNIEDIEPLWLSQRKIVNHHNRNIPYYDDITNKDISMGNVYNSYNISAENAILGSEDFSITINRFNFHNCNISLQGNLNELADQLAKTGNNEEAKELQKAAEILEQAEELQDKKEVKKKGVLNSVKRFLDDLEDEKSKLHKTVKGIKRGVNIAQDIAKGYNDIAQWAGLPQVPRPFLKKE